jgi:hypothetical protein
MFTYHRVHYDVLDEQGQVVATTAPHAYKSAKGLLLESNEAKGGLSIVQQSFAPLDHKQNLKLVLTGIERVERPNVEWKVNLKQLDKGKATFAYKGFRAAITGIRYGEKKSILELEEEVMFSGADFEILDESGSVLPINAADIEVVWGERNPATGMQHVKVKMPVEGLTKETGTITLRLKGVAIFERNVNWQVPIPPKP